MTPEEIANRFLPPAYFQGGTYDNLRLLTIEAIRAYGDERARQERAATLDKAARIALWYTSTVWSEDHNNCARAITASIRALD